jgi:hypothetical protein
MFSKVVKDQNGTEKTVIAQSEEELNDAAKAVESGQKPTYPNINVPVRKGHDLIETQEDLSSKLVDGTGAHNSPRDAVRDDGSIEGQDSEPVLGMDEPAEKKVGDPGNVRPATDKEAEANQKDNAKLAKADDQPSQPTTEDTQTV